MKKQFFQLVFLVLVTAASEGCSRRLADPPPASTSAELPTAAPGAIGAQRASLEPTPPPRAPTYSDDEEYEEPAEETDAGPETPGDEAGVAL